MGVLLEVEGDNAELAKDICMHVAAMRSLSCRSRNSIRSLSIGREILAETLAKEGKPEKIIDKMVGDGAADLLRRAACLNEQPFVKDDKQTVGKTAAARWLEGRPLRSQVGGGSACGAKPCRPAGGTTA